MANVDSNTASMNALRDAVFGLAKQQGKYDCQPNIAPLLMHAIGEVNEAHTAYMEGKRAATEDVEVLKRLLDESNVPVFKKYFKAAVKSTFEDELADIMLMILSIAGYYNIDIESHIKLKHAYNALRDEHSAVNNYK